MDRARYRGHRDKLGADCVVTSLYLGNTPAFFFGGKLGNGAASSSLD